MRRVHEHARRWLYICNNGTTQTTHAKAWMTCADLITNDCTSNAFPTPKACSLVYYPTPLPLFTALSMERTSTLRSHVHFSVYPSMFMPRVFSKGTYLLVSQLDTCSIFSHLNGSLVVRCMCFSFQARCPSGRRTCVNTVRRSTGSAFSQ